MTEQTQTAAPKLPAVMSGNAVSCFSTADSFALAQRMAQALASSDLVPTAFQGKVANCLVAIEMANRMGASVLMVAQNLNVIHGRPSWSSPFIIAALNSCGKFSPLRFKMEPLGEIVAEYEFWTGTKGVDRRKEKGKQKIQNARCTAYAIEKATGETLTGPAVTIEMAVQEGWYLRDGSKWTTMPDLMLTYRAAAFFGRIYASDVLMGMQTTEELVDAIDVTPGAPASVEPAAAASGTGSPLDDLNGKVKETKERKRKAAGEATSPPAGPAAPPAPDAAQPAAGAPGDAQPSGGDADKGPGTPSVPGAPGGAAAGEQQAAGGTPATGPTIF